MSKKPAFQFYPGDWRKDPNLSRATLEAKGAMIEIMCLAFESDKRGKLITGKTPWTIEEIAHSIGGDKEKNIKAVEELLKLKVLKKDKKNTIFSSRMVKDDKISKIRRAVGFRGGNPNLVNQSANQSLTPSSSSSSSTTVINKIERLEFDLKTSLPDHTLVAAEMNQDTMTGKKNTQFIQSQWKLFLHERMNDDSPKYYGKMGDLTNHFLNWIRNKFPPKHQMSDTEKAHLPGRLKSLNS